MVAARIGGRVIQRFGDPALELAYVTAQRSRQASMIRPMTRIFGYAMLIYLVVSLVMLRSRASFVADATLGYFALVLLAYSRGVRTAGYVTSPWIDLLFFVAVLPGLYVNCAAMAKAGTSGWNLSALLGIGLAQTLTACCLAFAASVSTFLLVAAVSGVAYAGLLAWNGVSLGAMAFPLNSLGTFVALLVFVNWALDDRARRVFKLNLDLDREKAKSDRLLDTVLPPVIAARLRADEEVADTFDEVAILFADIVGFTKLSERLGSHGTVEMLTAYFHRADQGVERFGIEKIKTIGDAYMAVAGALTRPPSPARAAVEFGAFLIRSAREVGGEMGLDLHVRVGVNMGEVVGGVIGTERLSYDYWGDTINVASRLEALAPTDGITVSEAIYATLRDTIGFHPPRHAILKNLGERPVYDVDLETLVRAA